MGYMHTGLEDEANGIERMAAFFSERLTVGVKKHLWMSTHIVICAGQDSLREWVDGLNIRTI